MAASGAAVMRPSFSLSGGNPDLSLHPIDGLALDTTGLFDGDKLKSVLDTVYGRIMHLETTMKKSVEAALAAAVIEPPDPVEEEGPNVDFDALSDADKFRELRLETRRLKREQKRFMGAARRDAAREAAAKQIQALELSALLLKVEDKVGSQELGSALDTRIEAAQAAMREEVKAHAAALHDRLAQEVQGVHSALLAMQGQVDQVAASTSSYGSSMGPRIPQAPTKSVARKSLEGKEESTVPEDEDGDEFEDAVRQVVHKTLEEAGMDGLSNKAFTAVVDELNQLKDEVVDDKAVLSALESEVGERLDTLTELIPQVSVLDDARREAGEEVAQLRKQVEDGNDHLLCLVSTAEEARKEGLEESSRDHEDLRREVDALKDSFGQDCADLVAESAMRVSGKVEQTQDRLLKLVDEVTKGFARCEGQLEGMDKAAKAQGEAVGGRIRDLECHATDLHAADADTATSILGMQKKLAELADETTQQKRQLKGQMEELLGTKGHLGTLEGAVQELEEKVDVGVGRRLQEFEAAGHALRQQVWQEVEQGRREMMDVMAVGLKSSSSSSSSSSSKSRSFDSLDELRDAMREEAEERTSEMSRLVRSNIGTVSRLRQVEGGMHALCTRELFWERVDVKLKAHRTELNRICTSMEAKSVGSRLTHEALTFLAGNLQRVGKLIAQKADYDIMLVVANSKNPAEEGSGWDDAVETLRQASVKSFLTAARSEQEATSPVPAQDQRHTIRQDFYKQCSDAIRVAVSKYRPTQPGSTLLGKVKMRPKACLACDRPFSDGVPGNGGGGGSGSPATNDRTSPGKRRGLGGGGGGGGVGNRAAVPQNAGTIPDDGSHITKDQHMGTHRPTTSSSKIRASGAGGGPRDGQGEAFQRLMDTGGGGGFVGGPYVYRGGFKLPKQTQRPMTAGVVEDEFSTSVRMSPLLPLQHGIGGDGPSFDGRHSPSASPPRPKTQGGG